jgi:hypothetical protein
MKSEGRKEFSEDSRTWKFPSGWVERRSGRKERVGVCGGSVRGSDEMISLGFLLLYGVCVSPNLKEQTTSLSTLTWRVRWNVSKKYSQSEDRMFNVNMYTIKVINP